MFITLLLLFTVPQRSATIASHFTFCEYCLELEKIAIILIAARRYASAVYASGFQTGVRGPKGGRDGFPGGPREDSEK